ncbi:hypothetical protein [Allokutzneria oryzae]|uniref:Uncharacterized protein n=1 Tax=Allokutzneria oryzae TaxID=1378989 RepID=A0ABV5ZQM4_9PSEU
MSRVPGSPEWTVMGTGTAGPHRVFADLSRLPSARIELRVVVRDAAGRLGADGEFTTLPR